MTAMKPATVETLKAFLDAFNRHDLDAIMEFFVDDCRFDAPRGPDPWGRRFAGKDQVREGLGVGSREFPTCTMARTVTG